MLGFRYVMFLTLVLLTSALGVQGNENDVDLTLRPDPEGSQTTVNVSVRMLDIDEISGAKQNFTANVAVLAMWKDSRLAGASGRRSMSLRDIWHPELQVMNQQRLSTTFPLMAQIEPDGRVSVIQRYWGQFSNPLALHDFPFDQHGFKVEIAALAGGPDEIEILATMSGQRRSGMADKLSLPDWDITEWNVHANSEAFDEGLTSMVGVNFEFHAKRRLGYYMIKVLLPLLMIVMMSWIVFWIHPSESGSQISVSITSMLTLIAYRFALGASLPVVSYLTKMDWFILVSTILVFVALLEAVLTSRLVKMGKEATALKIDQRCRVTFPILFLIVCVMTYCL